MTTTHPVRFTRLSAIALAACALTLPAAAQPGHEGHNHAQPEVIPAERQTGAEQRMPAPLRAEPREIKLGFVEPEQVVTGKTTITNVSDKPIKIVRTASSCSCTVAELVKDTLEPGESMPLEATLTAGKNLGGQQRSVRLWVEGYQIPYEVWVTAEVSYGVRANPVFVNALGAQRTGEIALESVDKVPFTVLSTNGKKPIFIGFDPDKDAPRANYTIKYDYTGVSGEQLPTWVVVETDHPKAPVIDLRVVNEELARANVPNPRAPWRLSEERVILGVIEPGASKEFTVKLSGRRIESPPTLTTDSSDVSAEIIELKQQADGVEARVRVSTRSGVSGLQTPRITFDWQEHTSRIDVFFRAATPKDARS